MADSMIPVNPNEVELSESPVVPAVPSAGVSPLAGGLPISQKSTEPIPIPSAPGLARRGATRLGQLATSLLGAIEGPQTRPQIDEKGNMTQVPVEQNRPGQIFRHMLMGALLGGAAAQEEHNKNPFMGFGGGFAVGGKAAVQQQEKQKEQQKTQAKEDWMRDQEKQKNYATNALMNSQTHHFLMLSSGLSLEQHDKLLEGDQVLTDALAKAGVMPDPTIPVMTESELVKYLQNPENAKKYASHRGLIVGRSPVTDAAGNLSYEFKLAFYKDNADIKVTPAMRSYFKSHGILEDKNSDSVLQVGKVLKPEEASVLFKQARDWDIQNMKDPKSQAEIAAKQAETAFYQVKTRAEEQDIILKGEERKKGMEGLDALNALDKAYAKARKDNPKATLGDALATLEPSQQIALLPKISEDVSTNRALLAALPKDETTWTPEQHEVWETATKRLQDAAEFSNITQRSITASQDAAVKAELTQEIITEAQDAIEALGDGKPGQVAMFNPKDPSKAKWVNANLVQYVKDHGGIEIPKREKKPRVAPSPAPTPFGIGGPGPAALERKPNQPPTEVINVPFMK